MDSLKKFIQFQNESKHNLLLLAFLDGEYIGNCCLNGNSAARFAHRATLGIALYQKYTNQGIGTQMMKTLIEIARELNYEQIELEVVADNIKAIGLYKKLGFEIYGTFPNNMKYKDGSYAEAYWMMKKL